MKKLLILSSLLLVFVGLKAQNKVAYDYDLAGNRIARKVVIISNPNYAKNNPSIDDSLEEFIGERKITIYPNPTKGNLAIEINGGDLKEEMRIMLYDSRGQLLINKKVNAVTTPIEMFDMPAAYYILKVNTPQQTKEYKIIKE